MRIHLDNSIDVQKFQDLINQFFPNSKKFEIKKENGKTFAKFCTDSHRLEIKELINVFHNELLKEFYVKEMTMAEAKEPEVVDDAKNIANYENSLIAAHRQLAREEAVKVYVEKSESMQKAQSELVASVAGSKGDISELSQKIAKLEQDMAMVKVVMTFVNDIKEAAKKEAQA